MGTAYDAREKVLTVSIMEASGLLAYVAADSQTSFSLSSEREEIDVSHKYTTHAKSIPGQPTDSLSLECYDMVGDAEGQRRLKAAFNVGQLVYVREEVWDGNDPDTLEPLQENNGYITSMERELSFNEAATFSLELSLQELWADVPAPV